MVNRKTRVTKGRHPIPPKTSRKELPPAERAIVCTLAQEGYSERSIAAKRQLKKSTVHDTIHRVSKRQKRAPLTDITVFENAPRSGRPHVLDERSKRRILRTVQTDKSTREKSAKEHLNDMNLSCSLETLQNVLYQDGLRRLPPGKKPKQYGFKSARDCAISIGRSVPFLWTLLLATLDRNPAQDACGGVHRKSVFRTAKR